MNTEQIGPLQVLAVGFEDPNLDGSILNELQEASDAGFIRIVDAVGVYKGEDGSVAYAEISDLNEDDAMEYGAWIGGLLGLGAAGVEGAEVGALAGAVAAVDEYEYGLDAESVASIAEDIPAGGGAIVMVIDHQWAVPLRNALRESGGILLAQDFLSPEALIAIGVLSGELAEEE